MAHASADRNLLFGILALQLDFISRDQLVAAMQAWVLEKTTSLGELLLRQGALGTDRLALLDALVKSHLALHGNDPHQSLAALNSMSAIKDALAPIADTDLHETLAILPAPKPTPSLTPGQSTGEANDLNATVAPESVGQSSASGIRFRILRPHRQGGLGEVVVAFDGELHREVALKKIKERHADDPDARARFLREGEITGRLEHPGIVPIYSLGHYGSGRPFYAMRFVKGDSLEDAISQFHKADAQPRSESERTLELRKLLGRFVDVCEAISYAHSRGVLHRDLKPGNIMLGRYGETLVVDWGLAKAQGEGEGKAEAPALTSLAPVKVVSGGGSTATEMGSVLGTPAYMSPEQAAGRLGELGPASDVYSLGATLYALLTGHASIEGERDVGRILHRVCTGDIPSPRKVNAKVPAALEAVCCKAMSLKAKDRYATAQELADEVERWLADEPVLAWPEPRAARARRWMRRHRTLVTGAAAALLVGVLSLIGVSFILAERNQQLHDANDAVSQREQETQQANEKLKSANDEIQRANHNLDRDLATTNMMLARSSFEGNNASLANGFLEQVPAKYRGSAWGLLKNYVAGSLFTLYGHTAPVMSVTYSPDGQTLASASRDHTVRLWDATTGQELGILKGHTNMVVSVSYSPDGKTLASASSDKTVRLWDAKTGQQLRVLTGHTGAVNSVTYSPDGQTLASASRDKADNTVRLWDAKTGEAVRVLTGHTAGVSSVSYSPDGQTLASASASWNGPVRLWDAKTGQELRVLKGHSHGVDSVSYCPDGQTLASADGVTVRLWDAKTGQELRVLKGRTGKDGSVSYSPDGQTLAAASEDNTVRLWDAKSGQELRAFTGHSGTVSSVSYSPDGQTLASASWDSTVRLWDAKRGQELRVLKGHTTQVYSVSHSPDGQTLVSVCGDATVRLWDAKTGQQLRVLNATSSGGSVTYSPDGQTVALACVDKTVRLWDAKTGQELRVLKGHTDDVTSVSYSPDGQTLASGSSDKTVRLWDANTGQELRVLKGHMGGVTSVAYSPDGQTIASAGGDDTTVRIWDAKTGQELRAIYGHTDFITSVTYSPDGQTLALACGDNDNTVRLWDAKTGQERVLKGHISGVRSVTYSPDGQTIASASADSTVRLWDAKTGQELRAFKGHTDCVWSVSYNPDGQTVASASFDGTVRVWDAKTGQQLRTLKGHTGAVNRLSYSPDGKTIASASEDRTMRLWDANTGHELGSLTGHTSHFYSMSYSPDGQTLVSSFDTTVRLWDTKTGQELRVLKGHTDIVRSVTYSPDGQTLASASNDKTVRLWDAKTGQELRVLRGHTSFVHSVSFSPDGQEIWGEATNFPAYMPVGTGKDYLGWKVQTGAPCDKVPDGLDFSRPVGASSPNGKSFALGTKHGAILLVPRSILAAELSYRRWVTSPDLQWHKDQVEQLQKPDPAAAAFHLGWYLAAQDYYTALKEQPAAPPALQSAILSRGRLWAGILIKTAGPALTPLLAEAARDAAQPGAPWQSHALYGAALYRAGDGQKALQELTLALKLRGHPNVWLAAFQAMAHAQQGETAKAKEWLTKLAPPADAPWEELALASLLAPEANAAVAVQLPDQKPGLRDAR